MRTCAFEIRDDCIRMEKSLNFVCFIQHVIIDQVLIKNMSTLHLLPPSYPYLFFYPIHHFLLIILHLVFVSSLPQSFDILVSHSHLLCTHIVLFLLTHTVNTFFFQDGRIVQQTGIRHPGFAKCCNCT